MSVFQFDERLQIRLPAFQTPYETYSRLEQEWILADWERIRAAIPDQIARFEQEIEYRLEAISKEEDWNQIVFLFDEITDFASRIHELNLWQRIDPAVSEQQTED